MSKSWGGTGVAYYDPDGKGTVIMRLYKITWDQFQCVQCQEGKSSKWYGKKLLLGTDEDGTLIYTITCEEKSMRNSPSDAYYTLIRNALIDECGLDSEKADAYLEQEHVRPLLIIDLREGHRTAARIAHSISFVCGQFDVSAAHFALQDSHFSSFLIARKTNKAFTSAVEKPGETVMITESGNSFKSIGRIC